MLEAVQIRILVMPVGTISKTQFYKYLEHFKTFSTVALSQIPDTKADGIEFNTGKIHYHFTTSYDKQDELHLLELHRQVFGVFYSLTGHWNSGLL
jgi:fido (protein-threonine AMPylation protein)